MTQYKAIRVNGVKYDEHRYIMEQHLGRKLTRYEVVHHINGDKRDNRLENLEVVSLSDHSRNHTIGRKHSDETRQLLSIKNKGRINKACRKLLDTDVEYIRQHYIPRDKMNGSRALARKFNVSHCTINDIINGKTYKV